MTDTATLAPLKGFENADVEDKAERFEKFEVKATSVDMNARTFSGLASTWELDKGGDVLERGAFKRTLGIWRKSDRIIPLLDSHDRHTTVASVVGKLTSAKETDAGLEVTFEVVDDDRGDSVLKRLDGGFVDGLSIGYRPVTIKMPDDKQRAAGVWRFLPEVELREVSVVVFGMNDGARVKAEGAEDEGAPEQHTVADGPAAGLAPDSSKRIAMARELRRLRLGDLAVRHSPPSTT